MKVAADVIIALTAIACLSALATSVYPGILDDLLSTAALLSFIVVPVVGIVALVGFIALGRVLGLNGKVL